MWTRKYTKYNASLAGITKKNCGWTNAKKEVLCEPGWICDAFELRAPELYKLVTTITRDDESRKIYTVPVG